jgi:predicted NUDIX family NTP pyrophosphohydrolase
VRRGKGNHKAPAIFVVNESNVRLAETQSSGFELSQMKFTGIKKRRFPEIDAVFKFFQERRKTGLFVSYDLFREEAIKKARFF